MKTKEKKTNQDKQAKDDYNQDTVDPPLPRLPRTRTRTRTRTRNHGWAGLGWAGRGWAGPGRADHWDWDEAKVVALLP